MKETHQKLCNFELEFRKSIKKTYSFLPKAWRPRKTVKPGGVNSSTRILYGAPTNWGWWSLISSIKTVTGK